LANNKQISGLNIKTSSRIADNQDSGGRDEGGITISRRPNKRPSRENAPGPSNAIATAVTIIPKDTSLASCKPQEGAGSHEKAIPRKHSPTKSPAYGVRNPIAKAAPPAVKIKPITHLSKEVLDGPERYRIPAAVAAKPTAARKSNKPIPGLPPGNVEYNLCSAYLPCAPSEPNDKVRYASMRPVETPHCGIFSYHFGGMGFLCGPPLPKVR
jgi:hypothetical protein